jgi:hypothetical protein
VERGTPGTVPSLRELVPVRPGREVSLYRVPGTVIEVRPSAARIVAVVAADLLAVAVLLGVVAAWVVRAWAAGAATRRTARPHARRPLL